MRENKIEQYLRKQIEARGGMCYKFVSPGRKNVPDRLCKFPMHEAFLVECKATRCMLTPAQQRERLRLDAVGWLVCAVSSFAEVDEAIDLALLNG